MTYKEMIETKRRYWTGKEVIYMGERHKVVDVDYNGALLIDKPARFTETTAVSESSVIDYHRAADIVRNMDADKVAAIVDKII